MDTSDKVATMRIGEVADAVGVNTRTIRFYEESGILPDPKPSEQGWRVYERRDVERQIKGDQRVHDTGLALAAAAQGQDMQEVLALNAQLQRECVACHASFRDRLADR